MKYNMMNYPESVIVRFWSHVNVQKINTEHYDLNACMIWMGNCTPNGYGKFFYKKEYSSHRFIYECFNGQIPIDGYICHECDNPNCVNPNHLFLGDHDLNMKDMVLKGRSLYGERNPTNILKELEVIQIKHLLKLGFSTYIISELFNVHQQTIQKIKSGDIWKYICDINNYDVDTNLVQTCIGIQNKHKYEFYSKNPNSKLNPDKVRLIRSFWKQGKRSGELSKMFNVSDVSILNIIKHKTYKLVI